MSAGTIEGLQIFNPRNDRPGSWKSLELFKTRDFRTCFLVSSLRFAVTYVSGRRYAIGSAKDAPAQTSSPAQHLAPLHVHSGISNRRSLDWELDIGFSCFEMGGKTRRRDQILKWWEKIEFATLGVDNASCHRFSRCVVI